MIYPCGLALLAALVAGLLLTPVARAAARRCGALDCPDGKRKLQQAPVPLWGGVAVYFSLLLGVAAGAVVLKEHPPLVRLADTLAVAAGMVTLVGCIDDRFNLNPRLKLLLQCAATMPVILAGYYVQRITLLGIPLQLGWFGVPLTVFWLLGCINSLNLLDGMDGLASVVGLSSAAMLAVVATTGEHAYVATIAMALAGALAAFLVYNLPPASIYLGDSGSMVIGLTIGLLGIQAAQKTSTTFSLALPAVVMAIPMLDTGLALVRRRLTGRRFDVADRGHIHHQLLDRGFSTWQALCVIGSLCLVTGSAAAAAALLQSEALAWLSGISVVVLAIRVGLFGHQELALVKLSVANLLASGVNRLIGSTQVATFEARRLARFSFDESWQMLVEEVERFDAQGLEVLVRGGRQLDIRRQWVAASKPLDPGSQWKFSLRVEGRNGRICELSTTGSAAATPPGVLLGFDRLLRPFARRWSNWEHPEGPQTISLRESRAASEIGHVADTASRDAA